MRGQGGGSARESAIHPSILPRLCLVSLIPGPGFQTAKRRCSSTQKHTTNTKKGNAWLPPWPHLPGLGAPPQQHWGSGASCPQAVKGAGHCRRGHPLPKRYHEGCLNVRRKEAFLERTTANFEGQLLNAQHEPELDGIAGQISVVLSHPKIAERQAVSGLSRKGHQKRRTTTRAIQRIRHNVMLVERPWTSTTEIHLSCHKQGTCDQNVLIPAAEGNDVKIEKCLPPERSSPCAWTSPGGLAFSPRQQPRIWQAVAVRGPRQTGLTIICGLYRFHLLTRSCLKSAAVQSPRTAGHREATRQAHHRRATRRGNQLTSPQARLTPGSEFSTFGSIPASSSTSPLIAQARADHHRIQTLSTAAGVATWWSGGTQLHHKVTGTRDPSRLSRGHLQGPSPLPPGHHGTRDLDEAIRVPQPKTSSPATIHWHQ